MKKNFYLLGNGKVVKYSNSFKVLERYMFKRPLECPWVYYELCNSEGVVLFYANWLWNGFLVFIIRKVFPLICLYLLVVIRQVIYFMLLNTWIMVLRIMLHLSISLLLLILFKVISDNLLTNKIYLLWFHKNLLM